MARGFSFATAALFSLALLIYPYLLAGVPSWRIHLGLPIMMLGVAGLFMHGLGFVPRLPALRIFFHPVTAWLLFVGGAAEVAF